MTVTPSTERAGRSAKMVAGAIIVGLIGSGALVWQASSAAFTAQTHNEDNAWDSGKVVLSDNVAASAWFDESNLVPGNTGNKCVEVEYDGDVASTVKLYTNTPTGSLGPYIEFDVHYGDAATCAGSSSWTQIFGDADTVITAGNDTLGEFATAHTGFANGAGAWSVSAPDTTRAYRFTWRLVDDNNAQDKSVTNVDLTWEAQNN